MNQLSLKKQQLKKYIDFFEDDQCEVILDFLKAMTNGPLSKGVLMKLSGKERNVDSALPTHFIQKIQNINSNFNTHYHVMDYNDDSFGKLTNVAEATIELMHNKLTYVQN